MTNASSQIDEMLAGLPDWRGQALAQIRQVINDAAPSLKEDWKWGTPTWTSKGNVVSVGAFKEHIKVNFFKGASLDDPQGLFNAGLDAKVTRSIDLHEGDVINQEALGSLVRAAAELDASKR
jgi:hypothetical protein